MLVLTFIQIKLPAEVIFIFTIFLDFFLLNFRFHKYTLYFSNKFLFKIYQFFLFSLVSRL